MRYLRFSDLVASGRFSNRMTLHRHIKLGLFPPGTPLGPNTRAWPDEEVALYDSALRAARDAGITEKDALCAFVQNFVGKADAA